MIKLWTHRSLGTIIACAITLGPTQLQAEATFTTPVDFKLSVPCIAYTSIRRQTDPVNLDAHSIYPALAENKPENATHTRIEIDGAKKWLPLECGEYLGEKPSFRQAYVCPEEPVACLPFFDSIENPIQISRGDFADITPDAPAIEPFGQAINRVCGHAGKKTTKQEFKDLLNAHPEILQDLIRFTDGKVFPERSRSTSTSSYLDNLTEAWYQIAAFDHIFCGEPQNSNKIGGLHFHGRYQQLQSSGEACRVPNFSENEVIPGSIYSMGVCMRQANNQWAQFKIKGYGLTLSGTDILKVVSRAFSENPASSDESAACILKVIDGGTKINTVFVRRKKGIRTFFPDASVDPETPACAASIVID
jgi:hypothetical protein